MPNPKLHKEDIPSCVKLKERGCNDKDIAAMLGVTPQTFSTWINHPKNKTERELSEALKKAESKAKAKMLEVIMGAAMNDGTWQAASWWLERKYPAEYGKAGRFEAILAEKAENGEVADDPISAALKEIAEKL